MRFSVQVGLVVVAFFAGIGLHYGQVLHKKGSTSENFLFVQTATRGTIDAIPGQPGNYSLQLSELNPYVTAFTDRPFRKAKLITTKQFLTDWNHGQDDFSQNAPNANLSLVRLVKDAIHPQDVTLELVNKKYDAKQKSMTYTVHILGADAITTPLTFNYAALFVDGCCCINC